MPIQIKVKYENWHAWRDHMGKTIRVVGTCVISGGGFAVSLGKREPQGINPRDLLLDLHITPTAESPSEQLVEWSEPSELGDGNRYDTASIAVVTRDGFEADAPPQMTFEDIH